MTWSKKSSGLSLNEHQVSFLDELASRLKFSIVVTSGIRSMENQIEAMFDKISRGEDLTKLYRDKEQAGDIQDVYPDKKTGIELLSWYAFEKGRPISKHLTGYAFDLRNYNLSNSQQDDIRLVVEALGGKFLKESNHIHIEIPDGFKSSKKKEPIGLMLLSIGLGILAIKVMK